MDGSPPGSPVPGTLQARTLEWVAIAFSKPLQYSCLENLTGRRALLATWGLKEFDVTEMTEYTVSEVQ